MDGGGARAPGTCVRAWITPPLSGFARAVIPGIMGVHTKAWSSNQPYSCDVLERTCVPRYLEGERELQVMERSVDVLCIATTKHISIRSSYKKLQVYKRHLSSVHPQPHGIMRQSDALLLLTQHCHLQRTGSTILITVSI